MNQIHICYTVNTDYTELCKISICNLIAHKDINTELNIYIVTLPNDVADISLYEKFNKVDNVNLQIIELDADATRRLNHITEVRHLDETLYSRWLIPSIPAFQKINKILHIDSDSFALKDLTGLYNLDLKGKPMGMCMNQYRLIHGYIARSILQPDIVFNAGTLLMDCNKLNESNIAEKILTLTGDKSNTCFTDEMAITQYFCSDVMQLPPTANVLYPLILEKLPYIDDIFYWNSVFGTHYKSFTELLEQAYIVHMYGRKENIKALPALDSIYSKLKQNLINFLNESPISIKDLNNEIIYKYI